MLENHENSSEPSAIFNELELIFEVLKNDLNSISSYYSPTSIHEQFWRRAMLRTLFSNIEAFSFVIKQMALKIAENNSLKLSRGEIIYISEKKYQLNNGEIKENDAKISTVENLIFAVSILAKVCDTPNFRINKSSEEYTDFLKVKKVRDRITHPKKSIDFDISDNELQNIRKVQKWYFLLIEQSTRIVIEMVEKSKV